jgi:hypothetical protein
MADILSIAGKVAGIGGLALGVFLVLFLELIRKELIPQVNKDEASKIIILFMILVWSIAVIGIIVWRYSLPTSQPTRETIAPAATTPLSGSSQGPKQEEPIAFRDDPIPPSPPPLPKSKLLEAARAGQHMIIRQLVNEGADINVRDAQGRTALMIAVGRGHFAAVDHLIKLGADVNICDNNGQTALSSVIGDPQRSGFAKLLVKAGARSNCSRP